LPTIYIVVRMTDSRLGVLGYLISIATYVVIWSVIRFRRRLNDLLSAIIIYSYPAALIGVLAASLFVHKIHVLIFGGGAQEASNLHRQEQFRMAVPALLRNPIGYGSGQSGRAMGYGGDDFIAIDSYWITLGLDYGALGIVLYVGLFAVVIYAAIKTLIEHPEVAHGETSMLIPLVSFLAAFLAIRGVFSQPEIHPLIFMMLGMAVALVSRAKKSIADAKPAPAVTASPRPATASRSSAKARPQETKKSTSLGTVFLIVLGCAVAFYLGCVLWRLTH
jgi:hypothetical protein